MNQTRKQISLVLSNKNIRLHFLIFIFVFVRFYVCGTLYHRYTILRSKKMEIMQNIELCDSGFYFEFGFDTCRNVGLCYDYNFSYANKFEICYYDTRNNGWKQIRTYL